jgi:hypothetical protein
MPDARADTPRNRRLPIRRVGNTKPTGAAGALVGVLPDVAGKEGSRQLPGRRPLGLAGTFGLQTPPAVLTVRTQGNSGLGSRNDHHRQSDLRRANHHSTGHPCGFARFRGRFDRLGNS